MDLSCRITGDRLPSSLSPNTVQQHDVHQIGRDECERIPSDSKGRLLFQHMVLTTTMPVMTMVIANLSAGFGVLLMKG